MDLQRIERRTEELAASVGPLDTLLAMARLEDALEALDRAVQLDSERIRSSPDVDRAGDPEPDDLVIDLREIREVLGRTEPVVERAGVRIADMAHAMDGR